MTDIQTLNTAKGITNNTDNEPVTKRFFIEFMTEFKRDLFEMLDIRFEKIEKNAKETNVRLDRVENTIVEMNITQKETNRNIEETNTMLEKQISKNAVEHVKFDSRLHVLEQA